jgi:ATP-dependent DNA ligase
VIDEPSEFVARVAQLGMEGVVAKRLSSMYTHGHRSAAWVKHKLRRDEQLAVIGARRSHDGKLEAVFVARAPPGWCVRRGGLDRARTQRRTDRSA